MDKKELLRKSIPLVIDIAKVVLKYVLPAVAGYLEGSEQVITSLVCSFFNL